MENKELTSDQLEVVSQLKSVHQEWRALRREYESEWCLLKWRFEQQYVELYARRRALLVAGEPDKGTPAVPNFWCTAMQNNRALRDLIEVQDRAVLAYLVDIRSAWHDTSKQQGFTLTFEFASNPFFKETVLEKNYVMTTPEDEDEAVLVATQSSPITWREGRNLTTKIITRKQKNKKTKQTRTITETIENPTFFNFFSNYSVPSEETLLKMSENDVVELELTIEADYEVGSLLRERIIPQALSWFTNEIDDDLGDFHDEPTTDTDADFDYTDQDDV